MLWIDYGTGNEVKVVGTAVSEVATGKDEVGVDYMIKISSLWCLALTA
jgi:hypothetical protein